MGSAPSGRGGNCKYDWQVISPYRVQQRERKSFSVAAKKAKTLKSVYINTILLVMLQSNGGQANLLSNKILHITIKHITHYKIFPAGEFHKGHEKNLFAHKIVSKGTKRLTAALLKCFYT